MKEPLAQLDMDKFSSISEIFYAKFTNCIMMKIISRQNAGK